MIRMVIAIVSLTLALAVSLTPDGGKSATCDVTGDAVTAAWELFDTGDYRVTMRPALGEEDSAMVDEILWQREQVESGWSFDMRGLLCQHPEWITTSADERGHER